MSTVKKPAGSTALPKTFELPSFKPKQEAGGAQEVKVPLRPQEPARDGVAAGEEAGAIASTTGGVAFGEKTGAAQPGGGVLGFMNAQQGTKAEQLNLQLQAVENVVCGRGGDVKLDYVGGPVVQESLDNLGEIINSSQASPADRARAQLLRGSLLTELGDPAKVGLSPDGFSLGGAGGKRGARLDRTQMRDQGFADIQAALPKLSGEQKEQAARMVSSAMASDYVMTDREQAFLNDLGTQIPDHVRGDAAGPSLSNISVPAEQLPKALEWRQELRDIYQLPNDAVRKTRLTDFAKGLDRVRKQGGEESLLAGQMLHSMLTRPSSLAPRGSSTEIPLDDFGGRDGVLDLKQWLCQRMDPNFLATRSPIIDDTIFRLKDEGRMEEAGELAKRYLSGFDTPGAPSYFHKLGLQHALETLPPAEQAEAVARFTKQAEANIGKDPELRERYLQTLRNMADSSRYESSGALLKQAALQLDPDPDAARREQLDAVDGLVTLKSGEVNLHRLSTGQIQGSLDELSGIIRSKQTPPQHKARAQALRGAVLCELADPAVAGRSSVFTLPSGKGKRTTPLGRQQLGERGLADLASAVPQLKGEAAKEAASLVGGAVAADGMLSAGEQELMRSFVQRLPERERSYAVESSFNDIYIPQGQTAKALQWRQEINDILKIEDQAQRRERYEDFGRGLEQVRRQGGDEGVVAGQLLHHMSFGSHHILPEDGQDTEHLKLSEILPGGQDERHLQRWVFDNVNPEFIATRGFIADKVLDESGRTGDLKDTLSIIDRYSQAFDRPGTPPGHHTLFLKEALKNTPPTEHKRIIDNWLVQARKNAATDPSVKQRYFDAMIHGSGRSEELDAQIKGLAPMFE